jgi:hypothetical protein
MPVKQITRASFHTPQLRETDLERAVAPSETEQPKQLKLRDGGNRIASIVLGGSGLPPVDGQSGRNCCKQALQQSSQ